MKKYLVALAALAVVFASCNKNQSSALTKIEFKQTELSVLVGDTVRLALLATPAEAEIPADLVITSSDTNIVKVVDKKVNIVGVGSGDANIVATVGDLKAVCKVSSHYYEEVWDVDWLYYFPSTQSEKPLNDSVYTVSGYKCRLYSVEYFCPNSIEFAEDLSYGEGDCLFATVSSLFVEDPSAGDLDGQMVARQFTIVETEEEFNNKPFSAIAGKLDPAIIGPVFQDYFEGLDAEEQRDIDWDTYQSGTSGSVHMGYAEVSDEGISYSYMWSGVGVSGWAARLADQAAQQYYIDYDFQAQWCYGFWNLGLATNYEATSYSEVLVQPYELYLSKPYHYKAGQLAAPAAPARKLAKAFKAISHDKKNMKFTEKPVKAIRISDLKK